MGGRRKHEGAVDVDKMESLAGAGVTISNIARRLGLTVACVRTNLKKRGWGPGPELEVWVKKR